jgi:hypothetical protein
MFIDYTVVGVVHTSAHFTIPSVMISQDRYFSSKVFHHLYFISSGESVISPRTSTVVNLVGCNKSSLMKKNSLEFLNLNRFL